MNITFDDISPRYVEVRLERLGVIGHISYYDPCKFVYHGDEWMKLAYDENTAILAAVEPRVTLMNITRRLTR